VIANFLAVTPQVAERKSAEVRREEILVAAMAEFALGGLHGTSTDDIARRAGISQPYLFRLFGTKKELFLETVRRGFRQVLAVFQEAAVRDPEGDVFLSMGHAYGDVRRDRAGLMFQMQAYAACEDPEVRKVVREEFAALYKFVESVSGGNHERVHEFFKTGMLINVAAAMDLSAVDQPWAQDFLSGCLQRKA
jgi:AcrR family transcriptional regulator